MLCRISLIALVLLTACSAADSASQNTNGFDGRWEPAREYGPRELSASAITFVKGRVTFDGKEFIPYRLNGGTAVIDVMPSIPGPKAQVTCTLTAADTMTCLIPILGSTPYRRAAVPSKPEGPKSWLDRTALDELLAARREYNKTKATATAVFEKTMGEYLKMTGAEITAGGLPVQIEYRKRSYAAYQQRDALMEPAERQIAERSKTALRAFFDRELKEDHISQADYNRFTTGGLGRSSFPPPDRVRPSFTNTFSIRPWADIAEQVNLVWGEAENPSFDPASIASIPTSQELYAAMR